MVHFVGAGSGALAKDTVYSRFGLIPIIFGDVITVYGTHLYIHVGKGHLVYCNTRERAARSTTARR